MTGIHAVVRWHTSQGWVVVKCAADLPFAIDPLWQVAQVRGATPA